jgi:NADPH2:quinone reductase
MIPRMRAFQVTAWGEPEDQLKLQDVAVPVPRAGEVRIRNYAAAVNFFDILQVQGKYQVKPPFPFAPGAEVAGVIDALGEGVGGLAAGDRVLGMASWGGFAEYTIAAAGSVFRIPETMPFTAAAAMPIVYQTSYFALRHRVPVQPGQWLLVLAGASGVGMAALQIGKAFGARVIAAAGADDKLAFCLAQGADHAVRYDQPDWTERVQTITNGRGADIIYDPVGGDFTGQALKCIAWEGALLVIGFAAGAIPRIEANRVLLKNVSIVGLHWGEYRRHAPSMIERAQAELFAMYRDGRIRPVVARSYPLADALKALDDLRHRRAAGKIVLAIP